MSHYVIPARGVTVCNECGKREEWTTENNGKEVNTTRSGLTSAMIDAGWTFAKFYACFCPECSSDRDLSKPGYVKVSNLDTQTSSE